MHKIDYKAAHENLLVKISQLKTERYRLNERVTNLNKSLNLSTDTSCRVNFHQIRGDDEQTKSSAAEKFKCKACLLGFSSKGQIDRHRKTKEHKFHEGQMQQMRLQQKAEEQKQSDYNRHAFLMESLRVVK